MGSVDVLDTASGNWSSRVPLTHPRWAHSCTLVGTQLYVIGGYGDEVTDSVEVLDTLGGDGWRLSPHRPEPLYYHHAKLIESSLYLSGGADHRGCENEEVFVFDTEEELSSLLGWRRVRIQAVPDGVTNRDVLGNLVCDVLERPCARYTASH
eukprot:TRINITY_DN6809_c0_g1_i2.p1 TRINITY_DN6809_c0_g1~~TRINITY_DN6809_c0_g1_i2.p1  ORF type:complete len:152 (-),score=18.35 TRINITY_DN6809_c0_g1_i2:183-638(-)